MTHSQRLRRYIFVGLCLIAGAAGVTNAVLIRTIPLDLTSSDGIIAIGSVRDDHAKVKPGIERGDIIRLINGRAPCSLAEAQWMLDQVQPFETVTVICSRGDSLFETTLAADRPLGPMHTVLIIVLGLAFFSLGLSVWWFGGGDPLVASFLRLNTVTGTAILLDSRYNVFAVEIIHHAYSLTWMICYVLIPAVFLDFIMRFTIRQYPRKRWHAAAVYAPSVLLFVFLATLFEAISVRHDPVFISLFSAGMNLGLGWMLLVYFLISLLLLLHSWFHAPRREEKHFSRWLLFCTFIGVAPFILLHKLPTLWEKTSLISLDQSLIFLAVAPIGWGMAVASFRLLKIERTLSRTLIYVTSAGIVIYALVILVTLGIGNGTLWDRESLIGLVIVAAFIAYLAGLSLAKGIRGVVDRVYYGDWYNFRYAVQHLSRQLAGSILEHDVVSILTERIPELLHIEKAVLLIRSESDQWVPPPQRNAPVAAGFADAVMKLEDFREVSCGEARAVLVPRGHPMAIWGISAILPLVHRDRVTGCLLLGRKDSQSPYSIRDLELLRTLSSFSGMAISNLQLHQQLIARECRAVAADLAGGIAHEINNALYPLKGQAQLILHSLSKESFDVAGDQLRSSVNAIVEMSDTIQRIADSLNHLSEPIRPKKSPMNLNNSAEEAIRILTETAGRIKRFQIGDADARYQLRRDFDHQLPDIAADSAQISQVFLNLILNAADAVDTRGGGVLTVGTRLNTADNTVVGFVEDTGTGIRPEHLQKIFQPYFTTKPKGKGTGLGLAMVQTIIESHGGRVAVSSTLHQGTRVEFALPLSSPSFSSE